MIVNKKLTITVIIEVCGSIMKVQRDIFVGSDKSECGEFSIDISKLSLVSRRIDCDMCMTVNPVRIVNNIQQLLKSLSAVDPAIAGTFVVLKCSNC